MITQDIRQTREAWDNIAKGYGEFVSPTHFWLGQKSLQLAELRQGMQFLDVAAGAGALSIPAARLGAKVLSVDLSPAMLQQLKHRADKEQLAIETAVMDGHALDLQDNRFDIAGSQFGVMLFPDMPRGVSEMTRVVRPGGRVLLTVYGDPQKIEFFSLFIGAIQSVVPGFTGPPMDPPPLPFQLQDPKRVSEEMKRAGCNEVRVLTITEQLEFRSGEQLWNWLINSNPIAGHLLSELQLTIEQHRKIENELEKRIEDRRSTNGAAILTNPINIGIGVK
jgi:ubiquinone/menaquinone biosynthesis C-methylase UbiE